ncbi:MAG: YeeE/YedE family protein [Alphaproteobacteria bacterium]|nr:YeeE/YedE family protein [Alphaproteobacteria bacterium]
MQSFTPFSSLVGGALIGVAAGLLYLLIGRIAGVSGVVGGLTLWPRGDTAWRLVFAAGLILGTLLYRGAVPDAGITITDTVPVLLLGGLLVGLGTRLSGGCTSGHGVCGIGALSPRSLAATVIFVAVGMLTATVISQLGG